MKSNYRSYFWIFFSAIVATLSHPTVIGGWNLPNLACLAFVAFVPLFYILIDVPSAKTFKLSFFFSFIFYSSTLYWLYKALNGYGHLPPWLAVFVLLLLVLILSCYFSFTFLVSKWISHRTGISSFWTLPVLWVATEWLRTYSPLGGFPWAQVGYTQWKALSFIQSADIFGVYGTTFLLVASNLAITNLIKIFRARDFTFKHLLKPISVCLILMANWLYGMHRQQEVSMHASKSEHYRIALLQGNIPQDEKWLLEKSDENLEIYQKMTLEAFANQSEAVQLVIWPEASFPHEIAIDLQSHIDRVGVFPGNVLLGAVTYENKGRLPKGILYSPMGFPIYNSALLFEPGPKLAGTYFKHHLVPYGEYVPLRNYIPFIGKLTNQMGEFLRGTDYKALSSGSAKIGVLICYEDIFPAIARQLTVNGANLLVNITNDAWYGDSSALPQHLSFSAFRAIENRRSLVRATNTGMTASFDAVGKIWALAPKFQQTILYDKVPLLNLESFYSRHGDIFAYACLAISGLLMLGSLILCRKN